MSLAPEEEEKTPAKVQYMEEEEDKPQLLV